MLWPAEHLRVALCVLAGVGAAASLRGIRLASAVGDHVSLCIMFVALGIGGLSLPPGWRVPADAVVLVSSGFVLAPRHRSTRMEGLGGVGLVGVHLVVGVLGLERSLPYRLMASFLLLLLAVHPLVFLFLIRPRLHPVTHALVVGAGVLWFAFRAPLIDAPDALVVAATLPLVIGVGYLVVWKGYPQLDAPPPPEAGLAEGPWSAETVTVARGRLAAQGLLAAGAAHEFKNTLAQVRILTQAGLRSTSDPRCRELFTALEAEADGAFESVAEVLDTIALRDVERTEAVGVEEALARLLRWARAVYRRDGIDVRFTIDEGTEAWARRGDLQHIVLCLLRNAAQSLRGAQEGGRRQIELRAGTREGAVVLSVEDSGGGVADEKLGRLFMPDPLSRGGSGVGLYIARQLAEANGGELEHSGRSRFELTLPLAHRYDGRGR